MPVVQRVEDYESWIVNIDAWPQWDGTVGLSLGECPIGRKSCVPASRPPYDECSFFMGVNERGGCCRLKMNNLKEVE